MKRSKKKKKKKSSSALLGSSTSSFCRNLLHWCCLSRRVWCVNTHVLAPLRFSLHLEATALPDAASGQVPNLSQHLDTVAFCFEDECKRYGEMRPWGLNDVSRANGCSRYRWHCVNGPECVCVFFVCCKTQNFLKCGAQCTCPSCLSPRAWLVAPPNINRLNHIEVYFLLTQPCKQDAPWRCGSSLVPRTQARSLLLLPYPSDVTLICLGRDDPSRMCNAARRKEKGWKAGHCPSF